MQKKKVFPVAGPKTAMHDIVFIFHFIHRKKKQRASFDQQNRKKYTQK